jgi:hypothetical protein
VQSRHAKVYFAGSGKSWELAAAEMRDLRAAFDRLMHAIQTIRAMTSMRRCGR